MKAQSFATTGAAGACAHRASSVTTDSLNLVLARVSRSTLAPGQETHGAYRERAERTLVGCSFIARLLSSSYRFPGVGISVVDQLEGIGPAAPGHTPPAGRTTGG